MLPPRQRSPSAAATACGSPWYGPSSLVVSGAFLARVMSVAYHVLLERLTRQGHGAVRRPAGIDRNPVAGLRIAPGRGAQDSKRRIGRIALARTDALFEHRQRRL